MPDLPPYELIDFGDGRKLERFGTIRLDRPSPAAEGVRPADPAAWTEAHARFDREEGGPGRWSPQAGFPASWTVTYRGLRLLLRPTPFGHVGMFPEQLDNWRWIERLVSRRPAGLRVLNLFAYTGGSTLAAAAAGAEVVHVDAARNVIQWARENARLSGLQDAPIRWIAEDVRRFVSRELRRGHRYHGILLDPPSYGHGPKGQSWKVSTDLLPLLNDCRRLLTDEPLFMLLTCHSPGYGPAEAGACLQEAIFGRCSNQVEARRSNLLTSDGRRLSAGVVARWSVG